MTNGPLLAPRRHGGDGARLARALGIPLDHVLDLSMSMNPFAPDVTEIARGHADALRRYPDPAVARAALAAVLAVEPDRVLLTNGGAEAIALVAAEWPAGRVDRLEFSLYVRHLARLADDGLRWRSNPNNPTGRLAAAHEHADVWDEAFYALATGRWTRGDRDAVVVGSLTKTFACPGLRVGYVVAPTPALARRLGRRQPKWSVGGLACAVVPELLARADLPTWASAIASARAALVSTLGRHGLTPEASDANFVLVRHAPGVHDHLARRAILVRDTASFGIAGGVRIAVPTDAGRSRLDDALASWVRS